MQVKNKVQAAILLLLFILPHFTVQAQQAGRKLVSGIVVDSEDNEPLIGAHIRVRGDEKRAAVTDKDGKFSIRAANTEVLIFNYVGYNSRQISVSNLTGTIKLTSSTTALKEVVVIGYGTVNKKDFTGSLSEVKVEDINKAPVPNIAQALAGRVAGLQVNALSGQPGEESDIVIRGGNSITQDNSPLYVVDGFPIEGFSLSSINPEEIEDFRILKDASATSIYGSRAANGVIIIETKKGKEGLPTVTYNMNLSLQQANKFMDMMNPYEFVKYQLELDPADAQTIYLDKPGRTLDDYKSIPGHDWQDMLFRTALMHNHNLSLRGGSKSTKYAFSGNVINQDGVIINSGFARYQGRARVDQEINKNLKVNLNLSYSKDKNYGQLTNQQASGNNSYATYIMYRTWGYRPVSTSGDLTDMLFDDDEEGSETLLVMNPIISTKNEFRQQNRTFFTGNLGIDYTLPWNLKLNIRGGYTSRMTRDESFNNSNTYRGYPSANNANGVNGGFSEKTVVDWMNENTLTYTKKFNKNHQLDALMGITVQGQNSDQYGFTSIQIPNEELGIRALSSGYIKDPISLASANMLLSYLARVNYNYRGKYLLTANFRTDGSSKFAPQNRWGYFPSFAAAWRLGKEEFFKNIPFISDSKLRASWGATGNNRVNDLVTSDIVTLGDYYGIGTGSAIPDFALIMSNFGNKDLKWETTYQLDVGYELSLFKSRLNFVFDYYNKDTKDLLLYSNAPYTSGYAKIYRNVGSIRNRGFEVEINSVNINTKNFKWSSNFNISFNKNTVLGLTDDEKTMFSNPAFTATWNSSNLYITQVGMPVSSFYGLIWDGVYQLSDFDQLSNGNRVLKDGVVSLYEDRNLTQPGDIKYRDINGDGIIDDKDKIVMGRTLPIHYGGFNNNFQYKNISLNVFFQWNYGNDIMNANRLMFEGNSTGRIALNQFASYTDRWTVDNPSNEQFRTRGYGPAGYFSTKQLEDGSYLRLKTVELTYRLPKKWLGKISGIDLSVAAQNLYTWSKYSGLDPEVSTRNSILTPGFDYSAYAQNFTIAFGAKVVF
ncbi:TonB-dependent receptor [Pedobacter sp. BS3]|uniref:SusC/RagA family TonB-linked outer membrane protein n=1 Tax=Pedobacter sp. BS3 TaxID=2567937 RepID=UPI0011EE4AFB|nr:TonB-dependent receptor [Pedobacter sp. BS3]TZF83001.1 TonB-dependent receptor [Pedobacter sp. BS3]